MSGVDWNAQTRRRASAETQENVRKKMSDKTRTDIVKSHQEDPCEDYDVERAAQGNIQFLGEGCYQTKNIIPS